MEVKYYCYRCGELIHDEYLKEKENLDWNHDLLAVNLTGQEVFTTYCCEYHHGKFYEFLEKFVPVIKDERVLELVKSEMRRSLVKDIESLEGELERLRKKLSELENS